jgi:hypothetical protein
MNYIANSGRMIATIAGSTTSYFLNDRFSLRLTLDVNGAEKDRRAALGRAKYPRGSCFDLIPRPVDGFGSLRREVTDDNHS